MQLASRTCCLAFLLSVLLSGSSEAQIPGHPIAGYADRLSVQPGQVIRFMVSSEAPQYDAQLVRLIRTGSRSSTALLAGPTRAACSHSKTAPAQWWRTTSPLT